MLPCSDTVAATTPNDSTLGGNGGAGGYRGKTSGSNGTNATGDGGGGGGGGAGVGRIRLRSGMNTVAAGAVITPQPRLDTL